jgi:endonuclease/exonuclease/phosphatase family metal-dependent hydrolase
VVLVGACAPVDSGDTPATSGDRAAVRVLVYNIHAGKDGDGLDNLERVARLIRDVRADLVLLQEVDRGTERSGHVDQLAYLATATDLHPAFGPTLEFQGGRYGIATLSRWPIAFDSLVRLPVHPPQTRAGGSTEPRGALHAVMGSPVGDLHAINTHLDPSPDPAHRRQELAALLRYGDSVGATAGLALIGGDLNAEPSSPEIRGLHDRGWTDAWESCGSGDGRTYPSMAPSKRIDYLFLGAGLDCRRGVVVDAPASDHRAVRIDLVRTN